jgi:hypothetical protein
MPHSACKGPSLKLQCSMAKLIQFKEHASGVLKRPAVLACCRGFAIGAIGARTDDVEMSKVAEQFTRHNCSTAI